MTKYLFRISDCFLTFIYHINIAPARTDNFRLTFSAFLLQIMDPNLLPAVLRTTLPPKLEKIKNGSYTENDNDYPIHLYLKENDIRVQEDGSDIIQFLKRKNLLITGATGFLGKLLLEKLLRCCKDIGTIYVVIRTKKGVDPQSRLEDFLNNWVFCKLSQIRPNYKDNVVGISGDFEFDGLGLSNESRGILTENVRKSNQSLLMFKLFYSSIELMLILKQNIQSTVRFDEPLKRAVKINIEGSQQIIQLAKECKKLDVFVHISTAYSNCQEKLIKEDFYPPHIDPYKLMLMTKELPDDILEKITPGMLQSIPNTYLYTKQISEDLVKREAVGLPACIQRPAIVIASAKEPIRSWVDNIYGPVGVMQGAAIGLLHISPVNANGIAECVPADFVINNCIAASYKTVKERKLGQIPIYNFTSSNSNPLHWKDLLYIVKKIGSKILVSKVFFKFTSCWSWLRLAHRKIEKFIISVVHFTLNEWKFIDRNTQCLWDELNDRDKENFPFDIKVLDWQDYFDTSLVALREFVSMDFLDTLDEGRMLMLKLDIIHYTFVTLLLGFSVYLLANTIFFFIPLLFVGVTIFYLFP
ncbi:unnamed protein product [Ceutorhynchus assimilis]|uniref:Fatty acyl-CoA reductase n=1 Tax=Ceutorhynchus assimilis TaxID=467358 RepID=A0A9N9MUJ5_9CUCU|nr:unnamed protein product [Ceutorhynchus assimilis]